MRLSLTNIGKIKKADVEIKGITVIAGENDAGKSTVGKALFSIFNSFYKIDNKIRLNRRSTVERIFEEKIQDIAGRWIIELNTEDITHDLLKNIELYKKNQACLYEYISDVILQYKDILGDVEQFHVDNLTKEILAVINISDDEMMKTVLKKRLYTEFSSQINNAFTEEKGNITLQIKEKNINVLIDNNEVEGISDKINLRTEAIYIDDPFVIDDRRSMRGNVYADHKWHLRRKLFTSNTEENIINEIIATNKINKIYEKINGICNGEVKKSSNGSGVVYQSNGNVFDMRNVSTGLKSFAILKTLLLNGSLEENGTIILDEPEIHLHPEWQLIFAELIVLLHKEFGMHILLNTHSPYFLEAIEVYAKKHDVSEQCKYYLATVEGKVANIYDVSEEIDKIYHKLARPLQVLENERYIND